LLQSCLLRPHFGDIAVPVRGRHTAIHEEVTPGDEPLTVFIEGPSGFTFVWYRESGWKFVGKVSDKSR